MRHANELGLICAARWPSWSPRSVRETYLAVTREFERLELPPTHLAAVSPGIRKGYGSYSHKRRHLEQGCFRDVTSITLVHRESEAGRSDSYGTASFYMDSVTQTMMLSSIPSVTHSDLSVWMNLFSQLAAIMSPKYGYVIRAQWHVPHFGTAPFMYPRQGSDESLRREHPTLWLHDIFPHNYLNADYLGAPVGYTGQSLREWIEADPIRRGSLTPFTDALMDWMPPVNNIPAIREELFRMGRVYYTLFLWDKNYWEGHEAEERPNPLYRPDPFAPWEAPPGPIPARFRAETYDGLDPGIAVPIASYY